MPRESYELQAAALKKLLEKADVDSSDLRHLRNAVRNLEHLAALRRAIVEGEMDPDVLSDKIIHILHLPREDVVKA